MFKFLRLVFPVLAALLLTTTSLPAFAAGPVTVTREAFDGTVSWSMDPTVCRQLQVPLSGTGQRHQEVITQVSADGSRTVVINDVVTGTASDSTGTYKFQYTNHSTDTLPGGSSTHSISMADTFILNGNGSAKLNVGFNYRWTYTDPAPLWPPVDNWQQLSTRGDPFTCDPI